MDASQKNTARAPESTPETPLRQGSIKIEKVPYGLNVRVRNFNHIGALKSRDYVNTVTLALLPGSFPSAKQIAETVNRCCEKTAHFLKEERAAAAAAAEEEEEQNKGNEEEIDALTRATHIALMAGLAHASSTPDTRSQIPDSLNLPTRLIEAARRLAQDWREASKIKNIAFIELDAQRGQPNPRTPDEPFQRIPFPQEGAKKNPARALDINKSSGKQKRKNQTGEFLMSNPICIEPVPGGRKGFFRVSLTVDTGHAGKYSASAYLPRQDENTQTPVKAFTQAAEICAGQIANHLIKIGKLDAEGREEAIAYMLDGASRDPELGPDYKAALVEQAQHLHAQANHKDTVNAPANEAA